MSDVSLRLSDCNKLFFGFFDVSSLAIIERRGALADADVDAGITSVPFRLSENCTERRSVLFTLLAYGLNNTATWTRVQGDWESEEAIGRRTAGELEGYQQRGQQRSRSQGQAHYSQMMTSDKINPTTPYTLHPINERVKKGGYGAALRTRKDKGKSA
ncbi:hypothetical protein SERLADRAFT_442288 [Serpula lacrymans var. lacrymans S7.9]|uniref:Uncharacterized protein n=1 Tax=Serpula lacrymans var. lacrymans (strain S7.9) TaxID=578457 RepID=F8P910_SERL9|nr:uncharacterized protein SERLADRAFT_442288 [Serpula lacrymans var. lacrymans S7.9]EGO20139.1 hypothetical protein SERLADRAFT_442288 [Serpula lacrymans var. lacrymans S7.9]